MGYFNNALKLYSNLSPFDKTCAINNLTKLSKGQIYNIHTVKKHNIYSDVNLINFNDFVSNPDQEI